MRIGNFSVQIEGGRELSTDHVEIEHGRQYSIRLGNHDHRQCDAQLSVDGRVIDTFRLHAGQSFTVEGPTSGDRGKFTAFGAETEEGRDAGSVGISRHDRGLVVVRFLPEYRGPSFGGKTVRPLAEKDWKFSDSDDEERDYDRLLASNAGATHYNAGKPDWIDDKYTVLRGVSGQSAAYTAGWSVSLCSAAPSSTATSAVTGLTGQNHQRWVHACSIDHDLSAEVVINMRLVAVGAPERVRPVHRKHGCGRCGCGHKQQNAVPATVRD